MDSFACYYCEATFPQYEELIQHLIDKHRHMTIKYREMELNPSTGALGYRTKHYQHIIPAEGEVYVTSDKRVGINLTEDTSKKSKFTPVKGDIHNIGEHVKNQETISTNDQIIETSTEALLTEMEMETLAESDDVDSLVKCIPVVLDNLKESGHLKTFDKFCRLIEQKKFPLANIGFLLFLDIIDWCASSSTSEMRYRPETRQFWTVGYRLFKGKFLRFMSGPKNIGHIVNNAEERGQCSPEESRINFAVPSVQSLSKDKLDIVYPGVMDNSISQLSQCLGQKYVKIGVDGKKIARGKGKIAGDIDCWGFESRPTLKDKQARLEKEESEIENVKATVEKFAENGHKFIPEQSIDTVNILLHGIILIISNRVKDLRNVVVSLLLGIKKFMKLADQSGKPWSKSRYGPVIYSLKISKYDSEKAIESSLRLTKEICSYCSTLNGFERCFSKSDTVDLSKHEKYHQMKTCIPGNDPTNTKQKSEKWFNYRNQACVTGSTCYTALGLGKLKDMQSHYDKVKLGKTGDVQFSEAQQRNMQYGTDHEIDGIATVAARILPTLFPSAEYFEEGCIPIPNENDIFFMVVSPDGTLREQGVEIKMMFENKCKVNNEYSTSVYYEVPKYYLPQLLCELYSRKCDELLFTCWSPQSTTAFIVTFDEELWELIWKELSDIYLETGKRPGRFPEFKGDLEKRLADFRRKHIRFVGEFPSCHVASVPTEVVYDGGSFFTSTETSVDLREFCEVECESILKTLHELSGVIKETYKLCRTSASEMLVFMANDLDRAYHEEINNAHPIAYALKGASMTNEVFSNMLDHVISRCEEKGLNVIATSADGQWHKYGVRGTNNRPLTLYQLQRDVWKENISMSKSDLLKDIRSRCKVSSGNLNDVNVSKKDGEGYFVSHSTDKPLKVFRGHLSWEIEKGGTKCCESGSSLDEDRNAAFDILPTVESFALDFDIDDVVVQDLAQNYDTPASYDIDRATTNHLSLLFDENINTASSITGEPTTTNTILHCNEHPETSSQHALNDSFSALTLNKRTLVPLESSDTTSALGSALNTLYGDPYILQSSQYMNIYSDNQGACNVETYDDEDDVSYPESNVYTVNDFVNDRNVPNVEDSSAKGYDSDFNQTLIEGNTESIAIGTQVTRFNRPNLSISTGCNNDSPLSKYEKVLSKLRSVENTRRQKWKTLTAVDMSIIIDDKSKCATEFQCKELIVCLQELNAERKSSITFFKSWSKSKLIDALQLAVMSEDETADHLNVQNETVRHRRKNPEKLSKTISKWLNKVPKETLAIVMAQNGYEVSHSKWISMSVNPKIELLLASEFSVWFSKPNLRKQDAPIFHFTDCCHVLTCLRTKICTTGISGLDKKAWEKAAESGDTKLSVAIVIACEDKQSVAFAQRMFGQDVEMFMRRNGYLTEAEFINLIREWFEAEDNPGIPAIDRCERRLKLRDYLLEGVNFSSFPPATRYIKGIPVVTYEALLVHIERKLQIYQYVPGGYCPRSLGTQEVEQFFSTIRDLAHDGQGTPKPDDIPSVMATAAYLDNIRMKPDRSFYMKTSRAPVYPENVMESISIDTDDETVVDETNVDIKDHTFDTQARVRRKQKRKSGLVSTPSQPPRRAKGVRQYHACDESKVLAHLRKGLPDI